MMNKRNKTGRDKYRAKVFKTKNPVESDDDEIAILTKRIEIEAPESGYQGISDGKLRFDMMPLSRRTLQSLCVNQWEVATEIQAASIPHALIGRDILGAAKTGSGKTLAYIIPLVEKLYREKWTADDGLGAIVISPTRELAFQIFEVLRLVGKKHIFSAGLVTGGKKEFQGEQERIIRMNILIATPGRLLQHLEQTAGFDASNVIFLVLDEADRILDMGFQQQVDGILSYLPSAPIRQTLLFSATQTKSIKALARLSLHAHPEYIAVHSILGSTSSTITASASNTGTGANNSGNSKSQQQIAAGGATVGNLTQEEVTPNKLVQNYVVCALPDKLNTLYSFVKSHLQSKIIIFFATCAQVRYLYELFCSMQPGISILALHGKIKQERRSMIYKEFSSKEKSVCLLATDIASRGLDFPHVDWVIQADAPEDRVMYIHRVGRTARYTQTGRALMILTPYEEVPVLQELQVITGNNNTSGGNNNNKHNNNKHNTTTASSSSSAAALPLKKLTVNPHFKYSVTNQAAALLAAQPDYRNYAKKAFAGYLRSIQLLPHYPVRDIAALPLADFAISLGLPFTPEIPVIASNKLQQQKKKEEEDDGGSSIEKGEAGDDVNEVREELRNKKNVNRTLDKLKKQIKEAKEMKKKMREEAKRIAKLKKEGKWIEGEEPTVVAAAVSVGNEENDDDEVMDGSNNEGNKEKGKEIGLSALTKAKILSEKKKQQQQGNAEDNEEEEEEEDDDFLTVKQVHRWYEEQGQKQAAEEEETSKAKNNSKNKNKTAEKLSKLKIAVDGKAKLLKNLPPGKKVVFDEDGNVVDKTIVLQDVSNMSNKQKAVVGSDINKRIETYMEQVKLQVDQGRKDDEIRDKERLKELRKKQKDALRKRSNDDDDDDDDDDDEGGGGRVAVLANPIEEQDDEEDDEEMDFDDHDSGDDEEDIAIDYSDNDLIRSDDDEDYDDDGGDEDAYAYEEKQERRAKEQEDDKYGLRRSSTNSVFKKQQKQQQSQPSNRKRKRQQREEGDDFEDKELTPEEVEALERKALRLLEGK